MLTSPQPDTILFSGSSIFSGARIFFFIFNTDPEPSFKTKTLSSTMFILSVVTFSRRTTSLPCDGISFTISYLSWLASTVNQSINQSIDNFIRVSNLLACLRPTNRGHYLNCLLMINIYSPDEQTNTMLREALQTFIIRFTFPFPENKSKKVSLQRFTKGTKQHTRFKHLQLAPAKLDSKQSEKALRTFLQTLLTIIHFRQRFAENSVVLIGWLNNPSIM